METVSIVVKTIAQTQDYRTQQLALTKLVGAKVTDVATSESVQGLGKTTSVLLILLMFGVLSQQHGDSEAFS